MHMRWRKLLEHTCIQNCILSTTSSNLFQEATILFVICRCVCSTKKRDLWGKWQVRQHKPLPLLSLCMFSIFRITNELEHKFCAQSNQQRLWGPLLLFVYWIHEGFWARLCTFQSHWLLCAIKLICIPPLVSTKMCCKSRENQIQPIWFSLRTKTLSLHNNFVNMGWYVLYVSIVLSTLLTNAWNVS